MSFNTSQARPVEVEEFDEDNFKEVLKWFDYTHFEELRIEFFKNMYYGESHSQPSFLRQKEQNVWERWNTLTMYIYLLEKAGYKVIKHIDAKNPYAFYSNSGERVVQNMIGTVFPDCHAITAKYILSGYTLKSGWEKEIVNYLKDDNISSLSDELIFILFSTKMPIDEFLEISKLPKSYLAKLLHSQ